ncbi:His Kinase A (phospho-acceptor) domain-containing protein [Micromonospora pattaloongensis]|uniref:Sensor-like histidine kinase SenX3 n=1 Tax=Micromonospora pattaloongensis TaxID=405436 RepID=A0A1H3MVH0_9ACTN|nr:ATP-binding protein [Micromonospora pattaloongensis]SDY80440.1 His Kinase A (phospho-acceptor) domain-containing protein [Micromonospora pattaloongensis]
MTSAVAVVGLVASGALAVVLQQQQDRYVAHTLARRAELVQATVAAQTERYVDMLQDLAVAVAAQSQLTATDFAQITSTVTPHRLSGVIGVSLVVPAAGDEVAQVQARWRRWGAKGLVLRPALNTGRQHRFVVLSRNLDGASTSAGQDLAEAPESYEAMDRATRTGEVAVTRTYVFLRDRGLPPEQQQLSFGFAAPIYNRSTDELRGWLVMGMRGQDFLSQALERISQGLVAVTLFDRSTPQVDVPVARWPKARIEDPERAHTVSVQVAQRNWELVTYGTEQLTDRDYRPVAAGATGGLITLLLSGLVLILATSRHRALAGVETATAALRADIERRQETEQQLRQRDAELRGFIAMATHDLRGPLASATAHTELLTDQVGAALDDDGREDLRRIKRNLGRMRELIEDLLIYATADVAPLRRAEVDLTALAREVVQDRIGGTVLPAAHVRIGRLPTVVGDPGLLRQLLDNLVGNAIKYSPDGHVPYIEIAARRELDGGYRIEIADRGIGIPEAERSSVFDAFHRAPGSEHRSGTGLGLAICRRVVTRHGGAIGVTANDGGGTRIWFTLPA